MKKQKTFFRSTSHSGNNSNSFKRNSKENSPMTEADLSAQMAKYATLSQEELMLEMFRTATESREKGELDNDTLDEFLSQASTMLTPPQLEKMKKLVAKLKV